MEALGAFFPLPIRTRRLPHGVRCVTTDIFVEREPQDVSLYERKHDQPGAKEVTPCIMTMHENKDRYFALTLR